MVRAFKVKKIIRRIKLTEPLYLDFKKGFDAAQSTLAVLRFTAFDSPFLIFKLFLQRLIKHESSEGNIYFRLGRLTLRHRVANKYQTSSYFRKQGICKVLEYKRKYQSQCARRVSGITFIRYAQCGRPNNVKGLGGSKPKGLNRIAKIG